MSTPSRPSPFVAAVVGAIALVAVAAVVMVLVGDAGRRSDGRPPRVEYVPVPATVPVPVPVLTPAPQDKPKPAEPPKPTEPPGRAELRAALAAYDKGDWPGVKDNAEAALKLTATPKDAALAHSFVGQALWRLDRTGRYGTVAQSCNQAIEHFTQVRTLTPELAGGTLLPTAGCYRDLIVAEPEQARGYAEHLIDFAGRALADPANADATSRGQLWAWRAFGLYVLQRNQESVAAYRQAVRLNPDARKDANKAFPDLFPVDDR
jgi:tetratricopeptide (TPR) repeat protein